MKILTQENTKEKLKAGIDKLADIVKVTLGGKGKNVILNNNFGEVQIINDGVTIAREVELEDPIENTGALLAKQAAEKTNEEAGDGTTTTIVLLQAFLNEIAKNMDKDVRGLREQIKAAVENVINKIDENKRPLEDGDIYKIARNSSLDDKMAEAIAELFGKIGKDGVIAVDEGKSPGITTEVVTGIKIDDGFVNPYMVTDPEKMRAEIIDTPILLSKKRIGNINDILPVLQHLKQKGITQLVIMAEDISDDVIGLLVVNKLQKAFNSVVVRTRDLEDLETLTGATIMTDENTASGSSHEMLGHAKRVVVGRHDTIVIDGAGTDDEIEAKVKELRAQLETAEEYEKGKLKMRIARLTGGVSVIKILGENEVETNEKKLKLEDAINAVRAAMEDGIVEGGGMALWKMAKKTYACPDHTDDMHRIMCNVLEAPFLQIIKNADLELAEIVKPVEALPYDEVGGFNVVSGKWEDLYESGIIDPAKVVKSALKNAFSMGNQILTAEASIVYKEDERKKLGKTK